MNQSILIKSIKDEAAMKAPTDTKVHPIIRKISNCLNVIHTSNILIGIFKRDLNEIR